MYEDCSCKTCKEKPRCAVKEIVSFIRHLCQSGFHGNLIIPFKNGKFGKVKKEEIIDLSPGVTNNTL